MQLQVIVSIILAFIIAHIFTFIEILTCKLNVFSGTFVHGHLFFNALVFNIWLPKQKKSNKLR